MPGSDPEGLATINNIDIACRSDMAFFPPTRYALLSLTMLRFVAALTLLASSNNKSLTAISLDASSTQQTLSILTRISINSSGTLVADPTSPDVILQFDERQGQNAISAFAVGMEPGNVTVVPLWGTRAQREARACVVTLHDGQHAVLQEVS